MKKIETLISVLKKKKTVHIADYFRNIVNLYFADYFLNNVNRHIANYFRKKQTVNFADYFIEILPSQSGFVFMTLIKNKENL